MDEQKNHPPPTVPTQDSSKLIDPKAQKYGNFQKPASTKGSNFDSQQERDQTKAHTSVFAQLVETLKLVNTSEIILQHESDKHFKKFTTHNQLMVMLFAQLSGTDSLRELVNGLDVFRGGITPAGLQYLPPISTIAYANEHRDYKVFETIFYKLVDIVTPVCLNSQHGRPKQFRMTGNVYHFDSTTINLCISMYDWALYRTAKGGIKIHTMLNHNAFLPCYALVTTAKPHDQKIMEINDPVSGLPTGSYICFDRGYLDYTMFFSWQNRGINFVTRAKDNISYTTLLVKELPNKVGRPPNPTDPTVSVGLDSNGNPIIDIENPDSSIPPNKRKKAEPKTEIIKDEIIQLSGEESFKQYPEKLRLVTAKTVSGKGKKRKVQTMQFLTNNMKLSPVTIADLYKSRWQIENFFKLMKQQLRINSFLGTSENAVKTQIYISLIAVLLLRYWQSTFTEKWCMSLMVATLRQILHLHWHLATWMNRKAAKKIAQQKKQYKLPNLFEGVLKPPG
jgi:hypothetical protein